ncbi:hypothetical protein [Leeuwenhoekiella nanhaiensis]|uniref:Uncharacterized protein n=1 Tax=Leeuwenhoekiella nanhaiensis TaxID=1655491 RepID=A0A2G1VLZ5_9FLAO|nr:hypothetical protein [Leeuwenhoekiella nanhaiensis]PHQ27792.1 hypothetical protein CJ305_18220 [Leeuwenhoekiella nanhaiensis]
MAKPQFSETQFVMGFLSEYFNHYRSKYPKRKPPFFLPTTSLEPVFASDFIIRGLSSIEFFQFKRSEFMNARRGDVEIKSGLPKSFKPYYRFKVYNDGHIPQFNRLRAIAALDKRFKVYYCAPKFHSNTEFQTLFWNNKIIENSAIINCNQFNQQGFKPPYFDINDGRQHYIVYNSVSTTGYLCSKPKGFRLTKNIVFEKSEDANIVDNETYNIWLINTLYNFILENDDNVNNLELTKTANESLVSKLFYSADLLMQRYGILTQLKYY